MTTFTIIRLTLVLGCISYLLYQFHLALARHSASVTDVVMRGTSLPKLTDKYWNILLPMLCSILFIGDHNTIGAASHHSYDVLAASICALVLLVSSITKLPTHKRMQNIRWNEVNHYLVIRICYLVVYELFFRGLLFQSTLELFPVNTAIAINVAFYTLAHIYSPRRELIACIPIGILLCWLRLESGTILYPIAFHLCMGIPFEIRMLRSSTLNHQKLSS